MTAQSGRRPNLTAVRTRTPPEKRDMGMVFQSYALWPHMTVAENVGYGLKRRSGLHEVATGSEASCSCGYGRVGGTVSRPAFGRTTAARRARAGDRHRAIDSALRRAAVNLDAVLREQMRFEIRSLQQRIGITGVYVTHSQDEALVLSDRSPSCTMESSSNGCAARHL